MRMKLKKKIKIKLNSKSLFIFLLTFSCLALISGIIFYIIINSGDKYRVSNDIENYFNIKEAYNYSKIFITGFKTNTLNSLFIWLLGISIIGIPIVFILLYMEFFSLGISISALVNTYGFKSILAILFYIFPGKLLYLFIIFILSFFSTKFSYKLIKIIFFKEEVNLNIYFKKYIRILILITVLLVICSISDTYISLFFIKLFNTLF